MCGRVVQDTAASDLKEIYNVDVIEQIPDYGRYNIGPTTRICIVKDENDNRVLKMKRWGLIPDGTKRVEDFKYATFNARAETLLEKKLYAWPFRHGQRCIVTVSGYYEWKKNGKKAKQPYYFKPVGNKQFGMAGLWDRTVLADGSVLESCTVITCVPNDLAAEVHDRMPVILRPEDYDKWLSVKTSEPELLSLLKACPESMMEKHAVRNEVGNVRNDDPSNITPVEPAF